MSYFPMSFQRRVGGASLGGANLGGLLVGGKGVYNIGKDGARRRVNKIIGLPRGTGGFVTPSQRQGRDEYMAIFQSLPSGPGRQQKASAMYRAQHGLGPKEKARVVVDHVTYGKRGQVRSRVLRRVSPKNSQPAISGTKYV